MIKGIITEEMQNVKYFN